ncbi:hypothetical protein KM043_007943 [Ampulex compressa]|nr:hypothetical protein KM043_007943 [Ampulex compressa]
MPYKMANILRSCITSNINNTARDPLQSFLGIYISRQCFNLIRTSGVVLYCTTAKDRERNKNADNSVNNSTNTSIKNVSKLDNNAFAGHKELDVLLENPKQSIDSIYKIVETETGQKDVCKISYQSITKKGVDTWRCTWSVSWPESNIFTSMAKNKRAASKAVATKCLQWLHSTGKLCNGRPILYDVNVIKQERSKAMNISIQPDILDEIKTLIDPCNNDVKDIITDIYAVQDKVQVLPKSNADFFLKQMSVTNIINRNKELKDKLGKRQLENIDLPIYNFRNDIINGIENNRVLLIKGDTGCGKTTQVPQYIIDDFTQKDKACDCNIIVSQPRRISALSLADRIAFERNEQVGDVVGYSVRFDEVLPQHSGHILFCTTGILLRKLRTNPSLIGISHVILDEAHERTIETDMLMVLLKRSLQLNPLLKLIIMSATINTDLFQKYFECQAIEVPGKIYPVQMHFMEDIQRLGMTKYAQSTSCNSALEVNAQQVKNVILWICYNKPPGAILCFLPGWSDILSVKKLLENNDNIKVLPMHSKISHQSQRQVFNVVNGDVRKVILATNIAETGITIPDIVYVVDTAINKQQDWNFHKDMRCITNQWVSQSNILQRKGRAGRVQPGESYHLISKAEYENLEIYPIPEILRLSLEKVILDSKAYGNQIAEEFCMSMPQPPERRAVKKALQALLQLNIIDYEENLTALGYRLLNFSLHPKLSKAIVYSTIFHCTYPMLLIANLYSTESNIFSNVLTNKQGIRESKKKYHEFSDHIALMSIYNEWLTEMNEDMMHGNDFVVDHQLGFRELKTVHNMSKLALQQLCECRMLPWDDFSSLQGVVSSSVNEHGQNAELILGVLYSATNHWLKHVGIGYRKGVATKKESRLQNDKDKAIITPDSVNYNRRDWPSPLLTYCESTHSDERRCSLVRDTSLISPLTALVLNDCEFQRTEILDNDSKKENILLHIKGKKLMSFSGDKETMDTLIDLRRMLWNVVNYILKKQGLCSPEDAQQFDKKLPKPNHHQYPGATGEKVIQ